MGTLSKIIRFLLFGSIPCLLVLVARPFAEALGLYLAYCLGGLAVLVLNSSKRINDPLVIRGLNLK